MSTNGQYVHAARLDGGGLDGLVAELRETADYVILEGPNEIAFPASDATITASDWQAGRVFNAHAELVWTQQDGGYDVRYVRAEDQPLPEAFEPVLSLAGCTATLTTCYLWGEDDIAIGGRLDYRAILRGHGRPQLKIVEYRDEAGRLVFYRYAGLRREEADDDA